MAAISLFWGHQHGRRDVYENTRYMIQVIYLQ